MGNVDVGCRQGSEPLMGNGQRKKENANENRDGER